MQPDEPQHPKPFMAPPLPDYYVPRPVEHEAAVEYLVSPQSTSPTSVTIALTGIGGCGKTMLATAICADVRVQKAFPDGVLWVTLGNLVDNLISKIMELIEVLQGERSILATIDVAAARLAELLDERHMLLVIDDVWDEMHLRPFLRGGPHCARLITTRNMTVPPKEAHIAELGAMRPDEAVKLLSQELPTTKSASELQGMEAIAWRLGGWPLALCLANGTLRGRVQSGESLSEALRYIDEVLASRGATAFDSSSQSGRPASLQAAISVTLELLTKDERARLNELVIFPEDAAIPLESVTRLWQYRAGLDELGSEKLCRHLYDLSLLLEFDMGRRIIRLHDIIRAYLIDEQDQETIASIQRDFLNAQQTEVETQRIEQIDQVDSRALADVWSKDDHLGFREYAKALADFIKNPKTGRPLTISIDAPWGMGKTTLMHLVEDELKETQAAKPGKKSAAKQEQAEPAPEKVEVFPTVWFNAWKYDQEESLWAALVLEILDQIRRKPYFGPRRRIKLWARLNWKRLDKEALLRKVLKSVGVVLGLSLLGGLLYLAAVILFQVDPQRSPLQLLGDYIATVGILGFIGALYAVGKEAYDTLSGPFDLKIADYIREPNYKERVGFLGEFAADFERVVEAITDDGQRPLIIFIDDLDRCAPPKPTEIIEAINVLLDAKYCVFIIGMDTRAVAASIEVKYKDLEEYLVDDAPGKDLPLGYHFLEKIVQFNFRVPRASPEMITRFIRASLGAAERPAAPAPTTAEVSQAKEQIQEKIEAGKTETQAYQEVRQEAVQYGTASTVAAVEEARQQVFAISFDDSSAVEQAVQKAAPYFDYNPRKIKRFINYYRLQALIAKRLGLLDDKTIRLEPLATWLLITMRWPGVLEELSDNRDLFGQLKQAHEVGQYLKQADRDPKVIQDYEAGLNPQVKAWSEDAELITLLGEITQQSAGAWSTYFDLTQMTSGSHAMAAPAVQTAK
jgi:hypothetical protein